MISSWYKRERERERERERICERDCKSECSCDKVELMLVREIELANIKFSLFTYLGKRAVSR